MRYAQVAIPRPLRGPLTYAIPATLECDLRLGQRVLAPFHRRHSVGYILDIFDQLPSSLDQKKIKEIAEILDADPIFSPKMLEFLKWMATYYCAPIGEVCRTALPPRFNKPQGPKTTRPWVPIEMESLPPPGPKIRLNNGQQEALNAIKRSFDDQRPAPILLYGITGSGKTEVYLCAFEELQKRGGQGLLLVPEISLTPQLVERFRERFKDSVAVYHSGLTEAQRQMQWHKMKRGEVFAVIGTRSALFAPFDELKLIVIDEEHDSSYKQEEGFLYHARDAAVMRAKIWGAAIVLGSATPSFETFAHAQSGKYHYFHLPVRATGASLPTVEIVDMRSPKTPGHGLHSVMSNTLLKAVAETLDKKEQVLIFLNRRGFSNFLLCPECGHVFECPNCEITLTQHLAPQRMLCHYCDFTIPTPDVCPRCHGMKLKAIGHGTERLEEELSRLFPGAAISRWDKDTQLKASSRRTFLNKMRKGEIDILVGTQIIAKGHDFPEVTLVGVVDADVALHLPDFRSFERTFQLITQVAGRAGRAEKPGKVIVQTYQPEHLSLVCAKEHDYRSYFEGEMGHRQALKYPPYTRLANVRFSGNVKATTATAAQAALKILTRQRKKLGLEKTVDLLGPAPAPLNKVRGKFRWHLLIKAPHSAHLSRLLNSSLTLIHQGVPRGCRVMIDVDPVSML